MPLQPARMRPWMLSLLRLITAGRILLCCSMCPESHACRRRLRPASRSERPTTNNEVVAVVNADPITRKLLADAAIRRFGADILDNMINRHLILQECNHRGIEVTKQEVSDEIRRLAGKFGLTLESYLKLLQEERDISPGQYSREIIWPMLALRRLVADQVQVTDDEFNRAFISQFGEAVKCRLIMVADRGKAVDLQQASRRQSAAVRTAREEVQRRRSERERWRIDSSDPSIQRRFAIGRGSFGLENGAVSEVLATGRSVDCACRRCVAFRRPTPAPKRCRRSKSKSTIESVTKRCAALPASYSLACNRRPRSSRCLAMRSRSKTVSGRGGNHQWPTGLRSRRLARNASSVTARTCSRERSIASCWFRPCAKRRSKSSRADLDAEIARAAISYGLRAGGRLARLAVPGMNR